MIRVLAGDELARLAYDVVSRVKEVEDEVRGVSAAFRSRSRELFEVAYYLGSTPMLAFAYAKAKSRAVERAFRFLRREVNKLEGRKEEVSYALYAAAVVDYLRRTGIISELGFNTVLDIATKYEFLLLPFLSWLKLISEAELEAER